MAQVDDLSCRTPLTIDDDFGAPLRAYRLAKQSVAQLFREMQALLARSAPWAGERMQELVTRLGEDRFQLVVLGQFKRGKTSLMNAIIGRALLPTGTLPVTSAVTSLQYGSALRAFVRRAGHLLDEQIPIAALPEFITERGNPGNQKQVLAVNIEVPAPFLRRGLHFVDTPGIGSAHEHNTATTVRFLPHADAAIFVTAADGPLSEAEVEFLDTVRQHVRKLFFVLNKVDQLGAEEQAEVLAYTTQLLASRLGIDDVRVFPVSATRALDGDPVIERAASGLPTLEAALATFLNEEHRTIFLVGLLDRAIALLEETHSMLALRQRAQEQTSSTPARTLTELGAQFETVEKDRQAVFLRASLQIAYWRAMALTPTLDRCGAETLRALEAELPSILRSSTEARSCYPRGVEWVRQQIDEQGAIWLAATAAQVDTIANQVVQDVQAEIAAILERPGTLAASFLGVPELPEHTQRSGRSDRDAGSPQQVIPQFDPPKVPRPFASDDAGALQRLPLPNALAAWLARRRLVERLPDAVNGAVEALRESVLAYLNDCLSAIDAESARDLAKTRQQIELAIKPGQSAAGTAGVVTMDSRAQLHALLERLKAIRDALLRNEALPEPAIASQPEFSTAIWNQPASPDLARPTPDPRLQGELGTCTVCAAASDAVYDFLCYYQYAIAHDVVTQREFLTSRGLCGTHTWCLERVSSTHGLSIAYPLLLDRLAERVRATVGLPVAAATQRLEALQTTATECPACQVQRAAEQASLDRFVRDLARPDDRVPLGRSHWLCLKHLRFVLTAVDDSDSAVLLRSHLRRITDLAESMREYVIKHDARRRSLMTEEELRAYRQSLVLLVGEKLWLA